VTLVGFKQCTVKEILLIYMSIHISSPFLGINKLKFYFDSNINKTTHGELRFIVQNIITLKYVFQNRQIFKVIGYIDLLHYKNEYEK